MVKGVNLGLVFLLTSVFFSLFLGSSLVGSLVEKNIIEADITISYDDYDNVSSYLEQENITYFEEESNYTNNQTFQEQTSSNNLFDLNETSLDDEDYLPLVTKFEKELTPLSIEPGQLKNLVVIGASIITNTFGTSLEEPHAEATQKLRDITGINDLNVYGYGFSGLKMVELGKQDENMIQKLDQAFEAFPDNDTLFLIDTGGNDITGMSPSRAYTSLTPEQLQKFQEDLDAVFDKVNEVEGRVIVPDITYRSYRNPLDENSDENFLEDFSGSGPYIENEFRPRQKQHQPYFLNTDNTSVVDMYNFVRTRWTALLHTDGVHLNAESYVPLRDFILERVSYLFTGDDMPPPLDNPFSEHSKKIVLDLGTINKSEYNDKSFAYHPTTFSAITNTKPVSTLLKTITGKDKGNIILDTSITDLVENNIGVTSDTILPANNGFSYKNWEVYSPEVMSTSMYFAPGESVDIRFTGLQLTTEYDVKFVGSTTNSTGGYTKITDSVSSNEDEILSTNNPPSIGGFTARTNSGGELNLVATNREGYGYLSGISIEPLGAVSFDETILGVSSDAMIRFRNDTDPDRAEIVGLTDVNLHIGQRTNNGNKLFNVGVIVFPLPDVPEGKQFESVMLQIYHNGRDGFAEITYDVDLMGVRYNSSSTVLVSDFDTENNVLLEESIITVAKNPPRFIRTTSTGTASLTNWIKSLYDAGAQPGDYAFIKLQYSEDPVNLNAFNSYRVASADTTDDEQKPQLLINYETLEETTDTTPPTLTIISPENTTYTNATILVNISATDNIAIDSIWYNWNGTNTTYTEPLNITFNEGSNTLHAWANDTSGNMNYTNISFTVSTPLSSLPSAKVFIMVGQSNMYGSGATLINAPEYAKPLEGVLFDATVPSVPGSFSSDWDVLGDTSTFSNMGPEISFAHKMQQVCPNETIVIIKVSQAGAGLEYWKNPSELGYQTLMDRIDNVSARLDAMVGEGNISSYSFKGFISVQGENEANSASPIPESYADDFEDLVSVIRSKVNNPDLPVLLSKVSTELLVPPQSGIETVRTQQELWASNDDYGIAIETKGLTLVDNWHYGSYAQLELGLRFANAWFNNFEDRTSILISKEANQLEKTNNTDIKYVVSFSYPTPVFNESHIHILSETGANNVVIQEISPFDSTEYQVSVSGMQYPGTIDIKIPSSVLLSNSLPNLPSISNNTRVLYTNHPGVLDLLAYEPFTSEERSLLGLSTGIGWTGAGWQIQNNLIAGYVTKNQSPLIYNDLYSSPGYASGGENYQDSVKLFDLEKTFSNYTTSRTAGAIDVENTTLWMSYLIRVNNAGQRQRVSLLRGTAPTYSDGDNMFRMQQRDGNWKIAAMNTPEGNSMIDTQIPVVAGETYLMVWRIHIGGNTEESSAHVWINPDSDLLGKSDLDIHTSDAGISLTDSNFKFRRLHWYPGGSANDGEIDEIRLGTTFASVTPVPFTDTTPPTLTIISPENITYNDASILVNLSASDDVAVDTIWYNWNGANVTYTEPLNITFNEGSNNLHAWANDTSGNLNHTNVTFTVEILGPDTTPPNISIVSPQNTSYNNATILVNISAIDNVAIDRIWFNWNGTNTTYTEPINITFNEGSNTLHAWANDTSSNVNYTNVSFTVSFDETIYGVASDAMVRFRNDTDPDRAEIVGLTDVNLHIGQRTNNGNKLFNVGVMVFPLPDVPEGKQFESVMLQIYHNGRDGHASITYDVDLMGVRYNSSSTVLVSDFDIEDNVLLEKSIITVAKNPSRFIRTTSTGTASLTNWIKSLYDAGAQPGDYAFIKLQYSEDPVNLNAFNSYRVASADTTDDEQKPQLLINYETLEETTDTTPPTLTIISPKNITYNDSTILVNIFSTDNLAVDSVWFNWNGTNTTYTEPINIQFNEGSNTLHAWANDTSGNVNYTSVSFTVDIYCSLNGLGTLNSPFEIETIEDLSCIQENLSGHYLLMNHLDFNDCDSYSDCSNKNLFTESPGWLPIGNDVNKFSGSFDGNNYVISNLFIDRSSTDYVGLFGYVMSQTPEESSFISNLGLENVNVLGNGFTGGLVGRLEGWNSPGNVSKSYVTGKISGAGNTGCLIGYLDHQGYIDNSYVFCVVDGGWGTGGLVGSDHGSSGHILNSLAVARIAINGGGKGGLVGAGNDDSDNSFWNIDLFPVSVSGVGKTTSELKDLSTFDNWDIQEGSSNFNNGYPYLAWQDDNQDSVWLFPEQKVFFVSPTEDDGAVIKNDFTTVNVSYSSVNDFSGFVDFDNDLVGYWNFENFVVDTVFDDSSYNNDVVLMNSALVNQTISEGVRGNFLDVTSSDAFGYVPFVEEFNFKGDFSVEAWVKRGAQTSSWAEIVNFNQDRGFNLQHDQFNENFQFAVRTDEGRRHVFGAPPGGLQEGIWYHLVGVFVNGEVKLYVDGEEVASGTRSGTLYNSSSPLFIGARGNGLGNVDRHFNGSIDEVKLWSRALTPEEISNSYKVNSDYFSSFYEGLERGNKEFRACIIEETGVFECSESRSLFVDLRVLRGQTVFSGDSLIVPISEISPSNSLILFSRRSSSNSPANHFISADFLSNNELRFQRFGTSSIDLSWEVVENPDFEVQRGSSSLAASESTLTIPISEVNLSSSFIVVNSRIDSGTSTHYTRALVNARFLDSENIFISRSVTGSDIFVDWQVVDWLGAEVQSGELILGNPDTVVSESINSVDLNSSFLVSSFATTGNSVRRAFTSVSFVNSEEVQAVRQQSGANTGSPLYYFVVSHPSLNVQRGSTTYETSSSETIESVNEFYSFTLSSFSSSDSSSSDISRAFSTRTLTSSDSVSFQKAVGIGSNIEEWFVVEMGEVVVPELVIHSPISTFYNDASQLVNISLEGDVDSIWFNWNGTNTTYTEPVNVTFNEGSNTLSVWANYTDGTLFEESVTFIIDTIPPLVDFGDGTEVSDSVLTDRNNIFVNVTASDSGSGVNSIVVYLYNSTSMIDSVSGSGEEVNAEFFDLDDGIYFFNATVWDNANNFNSTDTWNVTINRTPVIKGLNVSPNPIVAGKTILVNASGADHPNSDDLTFYCSDSSDVDSSNSICTGGNIVQSSPDYDLTCSFVTPSIADDYDVFCRVFDGELYSSVVSTTYTASLDFPITSVVSVAGDTTPDYFDTVNDGVTVIVVEGNKDIFCRWSSSDLDYSAMTNECVDSGSESTCTINDVFEQGFHTRHISCSDSLGIAQNSDNNLDVDFYLDYTAPTTFDDSTPGIKLPGYVVTIFEEDNIDSDPDTFFCTSSSPGCNPVNSIDDGGTIVYDSSNRGANYLRYYSVDFAGNIQDTVEKTIDINRLPVFTSASINSLLVGPEEIMTISTVSSDPDEDQFIILRVCSSDEFDVSQGCLDEQLCDSFGSENEEDLSCSFVGSSESGVYEWFAFIYDELGEEAVSSFSGSFEVDADGPEIVVISPLNDTYQGTSVSAEVLTSEPAEWVGYSVNGEANVTMSSVTSSLFVSVISGLDFGQHEVVFYANDSFGNIGVSETIFFTTEPVPDTTKPSLIIVSPSNNVFTSPFGTFVNVTSDKDLVWAGYSLNNGPKKDLVSSNATNWYINLTDLDLEETYTLVVYGNDSSNNQGNATITFYADGLAPRYSDALVSPNPTNESTGVTCSIFWEDTFDISSVIISENTLGEFDNHTISFSGNSGNASYFISDRRVRDKGEYECIFYAKDSAGNMNSTSVSFIVQDVTPPVITATSPSPGASYNQLNVFFSLVSDEALDSAWYKINTSEENITMNKATNTNWNYLFEGQNGKSYEVIFYGNDTSGNIGESSPITFSINTGAEDIIPPVLTSTITNNEYINSTTIKFNVTSNEDLSWAGYTINGGDLINLSNTSLILWNGTLTDLGKEAINTIVIYGNDTSQNQGNLTIKFYTDTLAPRFEQVKATPNPANETQSVTCSAYINDTFPLSRVIISENATSPGTFINHAIDLEESGYANYTINNVQEGSYECRFFARDEAGNTNTTTTTFSVQDVTPPVLSINSPSSQTYSTDSVLFSITSNEVLSEANYSLNNGDNISMSGSGLTWSKNVVLSNGNYNLTFYGVDLSGNVGEANISFVVDTTITDLVPPIVTVWSPVNNMYYVDEELLFNITSNKDLSWAGYSINSGPVSSLVENTITNWNKTVSLDEGQHNITFYANDTSSNRNQGTRDLTVYVDLNNPEVVAFDCYSPINDSEDTVCDVFINDSVGLSHAFLSHNFSGSFVNTSQISLSGKEDDFYHTFSSEDHSPGTYEVKLYVFDLAGRVNDTSVVTVEVLDDSPPLISNVVYSPTNQDDLDPGVNVTINATVIDDYVMGDVFVYYKNASEDSWNSKKMTNTTAEDYNVTIAFDEGNWTFYVNASDAAGNINVSELFSFEVSWDITKVVSSTISQISSFTFAQRSDKNSLGDIILNTTSDLGLNYSVSIDAEESILERFNLNNTLNQTENYTAASKEVLNIPLFVNLTGLTEGLYPFDIIVESEAGTVILEKFLNIQTATGPYLVVDIIEYSSSVTRGQKDIELVARVSNFGTQTARDVDLIWDIPSVFTITQGNNIRSLGTLPIGASATNTIRISVSSDISVSIVDITAKAVSSEFDLLDVRSVTILDPLIETEIITEPSTPSSSRVAEPSPALSSVISAAEAPGPEQVSYEKEIEIIRGEENWFEIDLVNTFEGTELVNLTIELSGFLEQYINITPNMIDSLEFNESDYFLVQLLAPSYKDYEEHDLRAEISGFLLVDGFTVNYTEIQWIKLVIQEIPFSEAEEKLEEASQAIEELRNYDINIVQLEQLLRRARSTLYDDKRYKSSFDLSEEILRIKSVALESDDLLRRVITALQDPRKTYLVVDNILRNIGGYDTTTPIRDLLNNRPLFASSSTEELVYLSVAAFERGDFDIALDRARQARVTLVMDRKGNFLMFVYLYWHFILLGLALLSFASIIGYNKYRKSTISKNINDLNKKEKNIKDLLLVAQRNYYSGKIFSGEYNKLVNRHRKELAKLRNQRRILGNTRIKMLSPQQVSSDLQKENREVEREIKNLQNKFYKDKKIAKPEYDLEFEMLNERLAEIEEEKVTLELLQKKASTKTSKEKKKK